MSVNTCLIYQCLSSASAVIRSWFIYELQKSTTIAFSRNSLYTFCSRNPTCGIPPCLRISNRRYLPMPSEFHNREPPLPFGNLKSRPWYSMDIFWNRPMHGWILVLLDFGGQAGISSGSRQVYSLKMVLILWP